MPQNNVESVIQLIEDLKERNENGETILVEGERDRACLRRLGISGKIVCSSQLSLNSLIEILEGENVIILTDWDEHGRERARYLFHHLQATGVKCDFETHKKFSALLRKEIKDVESLERYLIKYANIYKLGRI